MKYTHVYSTIICCFIFLFISAQIIDQPNNITNVGVAYFGIQSKYWPCKQSFKALDGVENIHISFLYKTFGMENKCLYKFIDDPRLKTLEIHLTNGSSLRNQIRRPYEILHEETVTSLNKKLAKRDRKILRKFRRELFRANKDILSKLSSDQVCLVSPILEHNLTKRTANQLFLYMKKIVPDNCLLVSNRMGSFGGYPKGADLSEGHGKKSLVCSNCINNLDGVDINLNKRNSKYPKEYQINEKKVMKYITERANSFVNFLWINEFNGKEEFSTRSDPRERNKYPKLWLFREVTKFIVQAQDK